MSNETHDGAQLASCENDDKCKLLQCEVCMTEVPASVAQSVEGTDYVHHFCGLECLGLWRARKEHMSPMR